MTQRLRIRVRAGRRAEARGRPRRGAARRSRRPTPWWRRRWPTRRRWSRRAATPRRWPRCRRSRRSGSRRRTCPRSSTGRRGRWRRGARRAAVLSYLKVLQANTPTHFAYFARRRLAQEPLAGRLRTEAAARETRASALAAKGDMEGARKLQTEAVLLSAPADAAPRRDRLREIYRALPRYREILEAPAAVLSAPAAVRRHRDRGAEAPRPPARAGPVRRRGRGRHRRLPAAAARLRDRARGGAAPRGGGARLDLRHRVGAPAARGLPPRAAADAGARAALPAVLLRGHHGAGAQARRRPAAPAVDHARGVAVQRAREVAGRRARPAAVHHRHRPRRRPLHRPGRGGRAGPVRAGRHHPARRAVHRRPAEAVRRQPVQDGGRLQRGAEAGARCGSAWRRGRATTST